MLNFSSANDYLKLAYTEERTYSRPASTFETLYFINLQYTSTGYVPMVIGEYTDANGRTFPMKTITPTVVAPQPFSPVVCRIESTPLYVVVTVVGDSSDPVAHSVDVKVHIFMQSVPEGL